MVGNILGLAIFATTELSDSIQLLHETMRIISEQQFRDTFKAERNVGMALKNSQTRKPQINQLAKQALYGRRGEH